MKLLFPAAIAAIFSIAAGMPAFAETNYTVFKVCEDQHVIRTSDGAEAGHVEYIVFDPAEQRIVSSVVSGGSLGERLVAVPFTSMRFGAEREVVLTEITRERLVSAPVIERTQIMTTARFEPTVVERSFTHFGVRVDARARTSETTRSEAERQRTTERRGDPAVAAQGQLRDNNETPRGDGDRERMARERRDGRPDAGRDGNRPAEEAARNGDRPPTGEARRDGVQPNGDGDRKGPQSERDGNRPPTNVTQESARPAGSESRRKTPATTTENPAEKARSDAAENDRAEKSKAGEAAAEATKKSEDAAKGGSNAGSDTGRKAADAARSPRDDQPPQSDKSRTKRGDASNPQ